MVFDKVVALCNGRKISIAALEKECGLANATIRGWKYSDPRATNLKKVADYFGVTMEYLLEVER